MSLSLDPSVNENFRMKKYTKISKKIKISKKYI